MNATKTLNHSKPNTNANSEKPGLLPWPESQRAVLKAQLAEEIHSRLNIPPNDSNAAKEDVVNAYKTSMEKLKRMGDDVQKVIPPLCTANLVYRQVGPDVSMKAREEALTEAHREMVARTVINIPSPEIEIDANVLRLEPNDLAAFLKESIDWNVANFADAFFNAMDELVDETVAGLANWTSPSTVQYSFVRQIVEQNLVGEKTETRRSESVDSPRVVIETKTTSVSGTNTHLFALHEHHVFDACKTTIENSAAVIPQAVQAYIEKVPDWLLPIHHIIDGKLGHKQVIEKKYRTDEWEESNSVDVFVYGRDPALVIGDVVLIGWDADDIRREETRRKNITYAEQQAEARRRAGWYSSLWGLLSAAIALWSLYLFWQPTSAMQLWAACAALFFVAIPCVLTIEYSNKARSGEAVPIMASLGMFCVLLGIGLLLAFRLSLWSVIGTSALLSYIGVVLLGVSLFSDLRSNMSGSPVSARFSVTVNVITALGCCLLLGGVLYFVIGRSLFDVIEQKAPPILNVEAETRSVVSQGNAE